MAEPVTAINEDIEQGISVTLPQDNVAKDIVHSKGSDSSVTQTDRLIDDKDKDKDQSDHHGHASGPSSVSLVASSIVCFAIYFVFCIVFSSVVWDPLNSSLDASIDPPFGIPQGVGINLLGITIGCIFFALRSGCKAIVAGPDLLPVVFFAEAGMTVVSYLASQATIYAPCDEGEDYAHRFLGGEAAYGDDSPCSLHHRSLAGDAPLADPELIAKVVPTTLIAMMIGNAVTGLVFFGLGKMKSTASAIGFIPASVVAGFLTCIGYKVIKLAVLITTGYSFKQKYVKNLGKDLDHVNDPWLGLTIALVYGIILYGLKHRHVLPAERLIIAFIAVPLVVFYLVIGLSGVSMEQLRAENWFLTQARDGNGCTEHCAFTRTNFWQTLQVAYGGFSSNLIEWEAVPRCIPIFVMGACMTSLDNMLKLTSSENALGIDLDYNHEMKLGGKATIFSSILAGSPAYGQTKFNVINLSIAKTSESSVPTLILGALCLVIFLSGVAGPIINFMPRFLLGGLCVFAGVGFLWENLWEGRNNMSRGSFATVWVIFLVNFVWEFFILQNLSPSIQPMVPGLLVVFILGIVLATFEFMFAFMHKAKPPQIRSGSECCSSAVRSEKHENQLAIMSPWFQVFHVESFLFFGTANKLYQMLKTHMADQKGRPVAERTKILIFDLFEVTGIDSSAKNVFFKVHRLLKSEGIELVWAMQNPELVAKFYKWGLYNGAEHYDSIDLALRRVEDELLRKALYLSDKWLANDTVREIFERQLLANVFSISVRTDEKRFSSPRLQPWSERRTIPAGDMLCGPDDDNLYMLYDGEIAIKRQDGNLYSSFAGSFFNIDRLLISIGVLTGIPSTVNAVATTDSTILVVSRKKFLAMARDDGALSNKILMTMIAQNESNRPGRVRTRVQRNKPTLESEFESRNQVDSTSSMASRLFAGDDYVIGLTKAQIDSFGQVFDFILEPGRDEVPMERFSSYVSMEARALGSQMEHKQFMAMIDDSGIDQNGDGTLTKQEFFTFLQGQFIANIPSVEIEALRQAYEAAVAESPDEPMDEPRVQTLFDKLGFDVTSTGWQDVIGVLDADGDGDVDFSEFLTGIGMMKQFYVVSCQLDDAFNYYKESAAEALANLSDEGTDRHAAGVASSDLHLAGLPASIAERGSKMIQNMPHITAPDLHLADLPANIADRGSKMIQNMPHITSPDLHLADLPASIAERGSKVVTAMTGSSHQRKPPKRQDTCVSQVEKGGGVELNASDLEVFFHVPIDCAEEMIFLADQDDAEIIQGTIGEEVKANRTIDRDEFQQLIRSWS